MAGQGLKSERRPSSGYDRCWGGEDAYSRSVEDMYSVLFTVLLLVFFSHVYSSPSYCAYLLDSLHKPRVRAIIRSIIDSVTTEIDNGKRGSSAWRLFPYVDAVNSRGLRVRLHFRRPRRVELGRMLPASHFPSPIL